MQQKAKVFILIIIGAAAVLFLLDRLIETDKEKVRKVIKAVGAAAEKGDWRACLQYISRGYRHDGYDYDDIVHVAEELATRAGTMNLMFLSTRVKVKGRAAVVTCDVLSVPGGENPRLPASARSTWTLSLRKEPEGWKITRVSPLKVGGHNVGSLKRLLHLPF